MVVFIKTQSNFTFQTLSVFSNLHPLGRRKFFLFFTHFSNFVKKFYRKGSAFRGCSAFSALFKTHPGVLPKIRRRSGGRGRNSRFSCFVNFFNFCVDFLEEGPIFVQFLDFAGSREANFIILTISVFLIFIFLISVNFCRDFAILSQLNLDFINFSSFY